MVKERMVNTYNFMNDHYQKTWNVVCCHNTNGNCEHCTEYTMAYVMGSPAPDGKKSSNTNIRMCPLVMKESDQDVGLTLHHELMHITSAAYDHPDDAKAYGKKGMI